ncbi:MAG: hypothetical protein GKC04_08205 [Methanomicrobiales archaeon]|nr:hypothetical protein [Methanomicrobiales archaeon]
MPLPISRPDGRAFLCGASFRGATLPAVIAGNRGTSPVSSRFRTAGDVHCEGPGIDTAVPGRLIIIDAVPIP